MKKVLAFIFIVLFLFGVSRLNAANTIEYGMGVTKLSAIDTDWNYTAQWKSNHHAVNGVSVYAIIFHPAATDDVCVIEDADTGASIFNIKAADAYDDRIIYLENKKLKPFLDVSDGTYTAGSFVIFIWGE